ncbi:NAD(+) diphosphatase [Kocuria palustris]
MPTDQTRNAPSAHDHQVPGTSSGPGFDRLDPSSMLSTEALDRRAVERERTDLRRDARLVLVMLGGRLPLRGDRLVLLERSQLPELPADPARPEVFLGEVAAAAVLPDEEHDPQQRVGVTVRALDDSQSALQDTTHGVVDELGQQIAAVQAQLDTAAPGHQWQGLRQAALSMIGRSPEDEALAVAAQAAMAWHLDHPRCPRCGEVTEVARSGWIRVCPQDSSLHFPRTDPAIIVAVTDGEPGSDQERLLLGRAAAWPEGRFSTLAGFVEPGESIDQAVRREIQEESGADVGDVRILGSQPWPFPRSLMIGCTARLQGGQVAPDGEEIAELRWVTREQLRRTSEVGELLLPGRISIARSLIEHWNGSPLTGAEW